MGAYNTNSKGGATKAMTKALKRAPKRKISSSTEKAPF